VLARQGDNASAEHWLRRANDAGEPKGLYNLGYLLEQRGDLAGAEHCWRRAAEAGEGHAMFNLGFMLMNRDDLAGAESWWSRAAAAGHPAPHTTSRACAKSATASPRVMLLHLYRKVQH
jgi:TPR repeat protein